jgi:cleavage and polyadenylation specificity factor subunit 2
MARIATVEEIEMIRDEQDVGDEGEKEQDENEDESENDKEQDSMEVQEPSKVLGHKSGKFIATSREVQDAFDSVNTLRYSQPAHLQGASHSCSSCYSTKILLFIGKCQGLTITPFNAGHTIGGTIWKIRSPSSGTILYAVNINHMKERHLDGTVLLRTSAGGVFEPLARPDLLITDAERASVISSRRKDRDAAFIGMRSSYLKLQTLTLDYRHCDSYIILKIVTIAPL